MNRRFSALLLSGLGAGAIYAAIGAVGGGGEPAEAPDPAAVDTYLAQLAETVPPPPEAALARDGNKVEDPDVIKAAGRADRVEPVINSAASVIR